MTAGGRRASLCWVEIWGLGYVPDVTAAAALIAGTPPKMQLPKNWRDSMSESTLGGDTGFEEEETSVSSDVRLATKMISRRLGLLKRRAKMMLIPTLPTEPPASRTTIWRTTRTTPSGKHRRPDCRLARSDIRLHGVGEH